MRMTRRQFAISGCLAPLIGLTGTTTRAADADPVLIEWSTIAPRSAAEKVRLRVHASGFIVAWPPGRGQEQKETRSPEEVRKLAEAAAEVVHTNSLSTEALRSELREQSRRTGLAFQIHEADDSLVRVRGEFGMVELRCPAPPLLANRFPDATRLQAYATLEQRLANLSCVVQCGGKEAAERLCRHANDRLRAEHPEAAAWSVDELMMVRRSADGGRFVQFRRGEFHDECWTTCVTESPGLAPRVTVIPPASQVR